MPVPDPVRRRLLGALAAAPLLNPALALPRPAPPASRLPSWAPAAGHIVAISYPAGRHPDGRGATLAEISPQYEDWNPHKPSISLYGGYPWTSYNGYCGCSLNTDTRQIVLYGAGHASINVCAPSCFDLNDLRWKWLDVPLPFDAFKLIADARVPQPPTRAAMESHYPPAQYDYDWGDLNGDWPGWPSGRGRPGKIQPVPTHTRAMMAHLPAAVFGNRKGALLYRGIYTGVLANSGNSGSHIFDYDTQTWSRTANRYATYGNGSVSDPVTGKVVAFGSGDTPSTIYRVFDVATRTWTTRTATVPAYGGTDHGGNLLHAESRLHIVPSSVGPNGRPTSLGNGVEYNFWATPFDAIVGSAWFAPTRLAISVQGGWPLNDQGHNRYIGWAYCPDDACLYAINGVNHSNRYWRLAPPAGALSQNAYLAGTWTLTEHAFVGGTLASPGQYWPRSFVYNRLCWDAVSRCFIWYPDSVNGPVQAFRPAPLFPTGG